MSGTQAPPYAHLTHPPSNPAHALSLTWKMWRMRAPPASSLTGMCSLRPSSMALSLAVVGGRVLRDLWEGRIQAGRTAAAPPTTHARICIK